MFSVDNDELRIRIAARLVGADEVRDRIEALMAHRILTKSPFIYQYKSRVKTADSIFNKIQDGREENPTAGYGLSDVRDIVGVRFISLFDVHIFGLFQELMSLMDHGRKIGKPVFPDTKDLFAAISVCNVFHPKESAQNAYVDCFKSIQKAYPRSRNIVKLVPKDDGYSSLHVQIDAYSYREGSRKVIPVEFQLRTSLEDTWAEISHQLKYKKRYSPLVEDEKLKLAVEQAGEMLKGLKTQIDAATQSAKAVRAAYNKIDQITNPLAQYQRPGADRPLVLTFWAEKFPNHTLPPEAAELGNKLYFHVNRLYFDSIRIEELQFKSSEDEDRYFNSFEKHYSSDSRWFEFDAILSSLREKLLKELSKAADRHAIGAILDVDRWRFAANLMLLRQRAVYKGGRDQKKYEFAAESARILKEIDVPPSKNPYVTLARNCLRGHVSMLNHDQKLGLDSAQEVLKGIRLVPDRSILTSTLCVNSFLRLGVLAWNEAEAARSKLPPDPPAYVKCLTDGLEMSVLAMNKCLDVTKSNEAYVNAVASVGNNILSFIVDLSDAGVAQEVITARIGVEDILHYSERLSEYELPRLAYQVSKAHTLAGIYRFLNRPHDYRRAKRTLEELKSHEKYLTAVDERTRMLVEQELNRKVRFR